MKRILFVFAIVHGSNRLFKARGSMASDETFLQAASPRSLAIMIKEHAIKNKEEIGISCQPLIDVLITEKGEVSSEGYEFLSTEEEEEFFSALRKSE